MTTNRTAYVYVGLAGETAPGRPVKSHSPSAAEGHHSSSGLDSGSGGRDLSAGPRGKGTRKGRRPPL